MMKETRRPTLIVSVQRALNLLEAIAAHPGGAPAKQLARQAGLPLATAYHLLRTLVHEGYVTRLDDGVYVLSDRLDTLRDQGGALGRIRPPLAELRDRLNAAAYLALYQDGEIKIVDIADGPRAPRVQIWVGFHESAHATALGKCVLAQLDPATRRDYLARHPLLDLTPHTITHEGELERRLDAPLAVDREEYALGTGCAAVPLIGPLIGTVAVSCDSARLPGIAAAAATLEATAARIVRALTFTI